jgi:DNA-binding NarL/FixJ family response regulator
VECHVEHIFNKTGTNRRTKLAALAATHDLQGVQLQ